MGYWQTTWPMALHWTNWTKWQNDNSHVSLLHWNPSLWCYSNMVMAQQTHLLLDNGISNPNLPKQFLDDIISQINQWHHLGKVVLVRMEANEIIDDLKSSISWCFAEMDLIDLHHHHYLACKKPATHQWGSFPIDLLVGSLLLMTSVSYVWMLPFGTPPYQRQPSPS